METREQQHLRILESGPRGPEDYEAVKYLKEKGYTNSLFDLSSNPDDTYGKVTSVFWTGPTANGLDYIELHLDKCNKKIKKLGALHRLVKSCSNLCRSPGTLFVAILSILASVATIAGFLLTVF